MKRIRNALVMPANNPAMLLKSTLYGADLLILDLEDAVSIHEKAAARRLLAAHLRHMDWNGTLVSVRVNSMDTDLFIQDMKRVVPLGIHAVSVPKIENAGQVRDIEKLLEKLEDPDSEPVEIIPVIETATGVLHAEEIAKASRRNCAITFGAADYTSSIGAKHTDAGEEYFFAREMVINACSSAGIMAMDTPCLEIDDADIVYQDAARSRLLGFDCKVCINPRQIAYVNDAFMPSSEEITWAKKVLEEKKKNEEKGVGVFAVDGKMVDKPVLMKAEDILSLVENFGGGRG